MAVNNEKMNKFYLAINHYAEEQRKKIEKEVLDFKRRELDEAEVEALTEAYRLIQKEMAQMRNRIFHEMAHREMDCRKELLAKRQKISDEVFARCREKLIEFTTKEEYTMLLEKFARELRKVFDKPGTVIRIKDSDRKYEERIKKAFGGDCTFEVDASIQIGGIRAYNSENGILADETLDSLLEDQHEWFEEHSGMAVV